MVPGSTPVHRNQVVAWMLRFIATLIVFKCSKMRLPIYKKYKNIWQIHVSTFKPSVALSNSLGGLIFAWVMLWLVVILLGNACY